MERNFNNTEFERFVKQNADQYRMIPSEKVWKGIHKALHTQRRRYAIGLSLLLITSAAVTWTMLLTRNNEYGLAALQTTHSPLSTIILTSNFENNNNTAITSPAQPKAVNSNPYVLPGIMPIVNKPDNNNRATLSTYNSRQTADENIHNKLPVITAQASTPVQKDISTIQATDNIIPDSKNINAPLAATRFHDNKTESKPLADNETVEEPVSINKNLERPLLPAEIKDIAVATAKTGKAKKPDWLFYFAPTVSYRNLSENLQYLRAARYNNAVNGGPQVAYPSDINTMVNHRPDLGFQIGLRTSYPLTKCFSLTGGLQFNVSKYDIKAYEHPAEMTTIALSNRSVSTISKYRNTNGYKENWLHNFYFSASLPIGAELKLSDGNKNYFGIGGTIQPTYVLDNRAYLISADYKNYAELPSLTRHLNVNTSFELFSAHQTGKVQWRVGPQVRYQLMSSFTNNYPIKEHLFDFGLKLGVQLR